MTKRKVVLVSLWYPVAIARYIEAALKRRDDIDLVVVGPYSGDWLPWRGGMRLKPEYAKSPDILFGTEKIGAHPRFGLTHETEARLPWEPDLWIQVDGGFSFANKPTHGESVFVATDPHAVDYSRQRGVADRFYCMQTPYAKPGDLYLPYAYDPIWHGYYPEKEKDVYDTAIGGLPYAQRKQLVGDLRQRGVRCWMDLGPSYDELNSIYHTAPIGLNWSSLKDLNARVFELLAMGRLQISNRVPDMDKFFKGDEMVIFENRTDAVEKVLYYLSHKDELKAIADRGRKAVQPHTWDARVDQILRGANYDG